VERDEEIRALLGMPLPSGLSTNLFTLRIPEDRNTNIPEILSRLYKNQEDRQVQINKQP
jgi:hypothetical protein